VLACGDVLLELEELATGGTLTTAPADAVVSVAVVVAHAHGIHARPAALIARLAKTFPYELEIRARGRGAAARSAVALMSLGIRGGDELVITGFEPAAASGIAEVARLIRGLASVAHETPAAPVVRAPGGDGANLHGVIASRGLRVGAAFYLDCAEIPVVEQGTGAARESAEFDRAREAVRDRLARLSATAAPAVREIMGAHLELLEDPQLLGQARGAISSGKSAAFAWRECLRAAAAALSATGDTRLAERVADLTDLERQVLIELSGATPPTADLPAGGILLARDLTPSQFIDIDSAKLGGIALAAGGATSHVAILAGTLGVPMLVAVGPALLEVPAGAMVILDAEAGVLRAAPTPAELAAAHAALTEQRGRRAGELAAAQNECHLASGERIEIFANLAGLPADVKLAIAQGAEGCGLLRTEFLFLERHVAPDEREQRDCYQKVADLLGKRPLVIRTLDIGGDKPIPYRPLPPEDNPALGLRGVRTSLWRPDLLEVQLRALLGVKPAVRILLPMITDVAEVRSVRGMLDGLCAELGAMRPLLGAMIETPAAAMLADQLAREVDFLSIGTNDLSQYTLAMDRGHAELAARIDGLHPAVLRLIETTTRGAALHGTPVAVCGGLASDPGAVAVLVGLGVGELSVVPMLIPRLKAQLGTLTLASCRAHAARALALSTAAEVRALAAEGTS
jgi:phosphocarrier protein FPr/phosphocarrier protein